ncbi:MULTISPECIES: hypothetical protein [Acidobacteriaceae]|uniref:hypothetical protein n=1 Tax=Acidobacteriaceae TaxID=204434 RepID=UPI00131B3ABC|nr:MULTISPECIES: hypothetical protein [Acidobacteriaceae]MDW5267941.1 hypothetical protein [Edaphobacter sp.]
MGNWNNFSNTLNGYGYSVQMPLGFMSMPPDPMSGGIFAWPPGSTPPPNSPALIWILPVMPPYLPGLVQHYYNFDNPMVAAYNAQSLGLLSVLRITPLRQTSLNGVTTLVREFDALSMDGNSIRMSAMLLQGPFSAVQCVVGISLCRWVEFAGSTLQFIANLQLNGTSAAPGEVRTLIDKNNLNHVEMQLVNADSSVVTPIMTLPTTVGQSQIFEIHVAAGGSLSFGDVKGTNVQIGDHNIVHT